MSDVTKMTDAEKAAKWDSLMTLTGGRVEELDNAMVSVASAVENMQSLLRRGADALERVRSDNSTLRAKLAEVERERDAARAERERWKKELREELIMRAMNGPMAANAEQASVIADNRIAQLAALAPQPAPGGAE